MGIKVRLRAAQRKMWPVAHVARLFEVSERLLWKWISDGCINRYRRPTKHHRSGITAKAIGGFLKKLDDCASYGIGYQNRRRRPAEEKGRAIASGLPLGAALTPKEFAARAGISPTTARRLAESGFVYALRPTPRRIKICHPSERFRKKRLTRQKTEKPLMVAEGLQSHCKGLQNF
jgi:transposase-like protein